METITLLDRRDDGTYAYDARMEISDGRIYFHWLPVACKDHIKAMRGSRWHGSLAGDGRKIWSILDCPRNRFQLDFLQGKDVYRNFDVRPAQVLFRDYYCRGKPAAPRAHQIELATSLLTKHCQIWAAQMRVGKTLAAQMVIEHAHPKATHWWWVGPRSSIPNIQREFEWWGFKHDERRVDFLTYEGLVARVEAGLDPATLPRGLILDEASRVKTATAKRTKAAQAIADLIRATYPWEELYIGLLSGSPATKSPLDWWSLAEIAFPGFLREGSPKALEQRLAFLTLKAYDEGSFLAREGWRDDERKCHVCGQFEADCTKYKHSYRPSKNEVAYLGKRLEGLVIVKHAKDCLDLPEVTYERIHLTPSPSLLRAAKAIASAAESAAQAAIQLRELSDGFQYREEIQGTVPCSACSAGQLVVAYGADGEPTIGKCVACDGTGQAPNIVRVAKEIPCPKDKALADLLDGCDESGRIIIFAAFTGAIDRICRLCHKRNWAVVRCDGRGFVTFNEQGQQLYHEKPLDYWSDCHTHPRVAYVAHPKSGGMSLRLSESRVTVFYDNTYESEYRIQAAARFVDPENHGCTVYDLIHLPTDERVLDIITADRKLELLTLDELVGSSLDCDGIAA